MCDYCENIDTIEHHLFSCKESEQLWKKTKDWMTNNLEITYHLTVCEVLFGIPVYNSNSSDIEIINFIILMTKWYINKAKSESRKLLFLEVLKIWREKIETFTYSNKVKGKGNPEWQERLSLML